MARQGRPVDNDLDLFDWVWIDDGRIVAIGQVTGLATRVITEDPPHDVGIWVRIEILIDNKTAAPNSFYQGIEYAVGRNRAYYANINDG